MLSKLSKLNYPVLKFSECSADVRQALHIMCYLSKSSIVLYRTYFYILLLGGGSINMFHEISDLKFSSSIEEQKSMQPAPIPHLSHGNNMPRGKGLMECI